MTTTRTSPAASAHDHSKHAGASCTPKGDGTCEGCGVAMVDCEVCGGIGYHTELCTEGDDAIAPARSVDARKHETAVLAVLAQVEDLTAPEARAVLSAALSAFAPDDAICVCESCSGDAVPGHYCARCARLGCPAAGVGVCGEEHDQDHGGSDDSKR